MQIAFRLDVQLAFLSGATLAECILTLQLGMTLTDKNTLSYNFPT